MAKFQPRAQDEGNDDGLKEKMIAVNRVTKVVKGGRTLSFAALTVVGDGDGRIGMGKGKAKEVPVAVQKAMEAARRNMKKVSLRNGTIHHNVRGEHGAAKVLMAPAKPGDRHHCRRPDARGLRSDGRHRHRGQEPRLVQPVQHGARHARRLKRSTTPGEVAAKRGKSVEDIFN
jgi:small subunit ribosomal protein S5